MTLDKVYAKIQEDAKTKNQVDGRRFNSRSREKMQREIALIKKINHNNRLKSASTKHLYKGMYSQEDVDRSRQEKKDFRKE
ncbi:unnamed protein product, partial [Pylaiella littoralis]